MIDPLIIDAPDDCTGPCEDYPRCPCGELFIVDAGDTPTPPDNSGRLLAFSLGLAFVAMVAVAVLSR